MARKGNRTREGELEVRIPIGDWEQEIVADSLTITKEGDILALVEEGRSTGQAAKAAVVSRELGHAEDTILPTNKYLLYSGVQHEVIRRLASASKSYRVGGIKFRSPKFIGPISVAGDSDPPDENYIVNDGDRNGYDRAVGYLLGAWIGHLVRRLVIVHEFGGPKAIETVRTLVLERVNEIFDQLSKPKDNGEPEN